MFCGVNANRPVTVDSKIKTGYTADGIMKQAGIDY